MKVAPVYRALRARGAAVHLVHTGQHYDDNMNEVFFADLGLPAPDDHLGVGSGTHAEQTARVMLGFEPLCRRVAPRGVIVVGDVNSTVACALVAVKLGIPVAHVEAGLRSRDYGMPEEINRVLTDRISAWLLTPSADADENLVSEGVPTRRIFRVGNVMIDTLRHNLERARHLRVAAELGLQPGRYAVLTLHRPSNVDSPEAFERVWGAIERVARRVPVVFPIHPRTRARAEQFGMWERVQRAPGVLVREPMGYLAFLSLVSEAGLVLTDSGGLQEETTALGLACLTLRPNTERPITVERGTNTVVGTDPDRIVTEVERILEGAGKSGRIPELWDGHAADRIADVLLDPAGAPAL